MDASLSNYVDWKKPEKKEVVLHESVKGKSLVVSSSLGPHAL